MVVGDSVSAGQDLPSYRMPLFQQLQAQSCGVEMVGDQTLTSFQFDDPINSPGRSFPSFPSSFKQPAGAHWDAANGDDTDHQAFPGIHTEQIANGVSNSAYVVKPVAKYVGIEQPNFVLLHTGTNDLLKAIREGMRSTSEINRWADTTFDEVEQIIDNTIDAHFNPNELKILLANFIPPKAPGNQDAIDAGRRAATALKNRIEAYVRGRSDNRVLVVDVVTGFRISTMTTDGVHPNVIGEKHIADAFLSVLLDAGVCSTNTGSSSTADSKGEVMMTSPSAGSTLPGSSATFNWSTNKTGIVRWILRIGSSSGARNYFDSIRMDGSQRSIVATGLPTNGSTVHVQLLYKPSASKPWEDVRYTYKASGGTSSGGSTTNDNSSSGGTTNASNTPSMVSPVAGSTLSGSSATFNWSSSDKGIVRWIVRIGSSSGARNYFESARMSGSQRSVVATGLPTNGSTVHVQLLYKPSATTPWKDVRYTYKAASSSGSSSSDSSNSSGSSSGGTTSSSGNSNPPAMTSPASGSTLSGSSATFTWSSTNPNINQFWIYIGSSAGASNYFNSGRITDKSKRSIVATGLPTGGQTVHVTLRYKTPEPWADVRYTYKAKAASSSSSSSSGSTSTASSSSGSTSSSSSSSTTSSSSGGNGFTPPPLVLSKVRWLHNDVSGWPETATMSSVQVTSTQVCMNYNKAGKWPVVKIASARNADLVGNPWVFMYNRSQSAWYAATWEWLRPNQLCKAKKSVNGDHIKKSPYTAASGWKPSSGETVYFMVSGLARTATRNVQSRTKPVKVIWP